jgi:hypothetical protein
MINDKSTNTSAVEKMVSFLDALKNKYGIDNPESIRRGIALLYIAKEHQEQGLRLAFVDDNNKVISVVQSL